MTDITTVEARRRALKDRFVDRDRHMDMVSLVRRGEIDRLFPDLFSDDIPKSVVANLVDVAARDLAEMMAPLPNLACAAGNMKTDADRHRASRKNRIGYYYWECSQLERQMYEFADSYNSHGFAVFLVEPDFKGKLPRIRAENPIGCYYALDRWGRVTEFAKETWASAGELAALYPEYYGQIMSLGEGKRQRGSDSHLTIVRWIDKTGTVVYLPECNVTLASSPNPTVCPPVVVVERFGLDTVPRGQFDDVIWVQLARSLMALYQLSAAEKSVNAPLAMPDDVTELSIGPDAVLRTQNPQAIQRVRLDVPRDSWMLSDQLDRESKQGARYPDARTGGVKGSIITGRGVEAMLGGFDSQIKTAQVLFKQALELATSLCFEMDVSLWPNIRKTINGTMSGKSYEIQYVPARDISDNTNCSVTYGFAAGMTPSQAIVTLLQLRGDKLIQRDTFRRALPFDVDPEEEQRGLDVEDLEDGLKQGFMSLMQGIGPMMQSGGDPMKILKAASSAISDRAKGKPLHEAIMIALTPEEKPPDPNSVAASDPAAEGGPQGAGPGGEGEPTALPGMQDNGMPRGVAPGQVAAGPGGMPSIMSLIAEMKGKTGSTPNLQAGIMRKIPTGL